MKYADLHLHSSYSDGTMTPEEIIGVAVDKGVKSISITDHDSIASQYIVKKSYKDLMVIPGIELSTEYNDLELHILGYFIDIDNNSLKSVVEELNVRRVNRIEEILFNLKKHNIFLTMEDLLIGENATMGRSHIANAMVRKGYFDNYKEAFTTFLVSGKPGFVKGYKISYKDTIEIIKEAKGIPVIAHPGQIYRPLEIESIVRELRCYGLQGIEVYHPSHSKSQVNSFYNMAKKLKLFITGGSDYHGRQSLHETGLGSYGINELLLNKLINFNERK